jgi:hypothetical protein
MLATTKKSIIIVTENIDGKIYTITADSINEVLDDWLGECECVPENDAKIYFAMVCGRMINIEEINTFEKLMDFFQIVINGKLKFHLWKKIITQ